MSSDVAELVRDAEVMPDGWRAAPFSALADYVNGRAFKPEDWGTEGLPIIRIAQITNPDAETNFYDGAVDPRNLIDDDDLIFSWSATLAVMRWRKGPAVLNQHLFKVTPAEGIDRDWLQFRLEASIPDLADEAHGTTMKHIRKGTLSSQSTIVPPLDEQRRIAEVLRSVDEAIAAQRATVEQHTRLIEAIFEEWSNQSATLIALGDLLDFKNGINFEKDEKGDEGTLTLDVMNMFSADLTPKYEGAYRISKIVPPDLLLHRGDILFVRSSVKQQGVGWTSLADGFGENTTFCGFIIRGRPKRDDFLSRFVVGVLRAPKYRRWLIQHSTRSALTNINQKTIASVEIPLPSFAEQEELVEQYEGLAAAAFDAGAALAMLERLRANVAQDLLSGRVRVPA